MLPNRMLAIADHMAGHAFGGSDELAIDDDETMIEAFDVAFNDDGPAMFTGLLERDLDFLGFAQVDRDAAAMIARERLQHNRVANPFGGAHGLRRVAGNSLFRNRMTQNCSVSRSIGSGMLSPR